MSKHQQSMLAATLLVGCAGILGHNIASAQNYNFYQSPSFLQGNVTTPSWTMNQKIAENARDNLKKLGADKSNVKERSSSTKPSITPERKPSGATATGGSPADYMRRASASNNPLPYTRDRVLSTKIRDDFLKDYAKQMPSDVADMRATTEQNDLVQIIAGLVQLQGIDSSRMEGIMAIWYGQSWAIANQRPLPTPQQYQGIANQIRGPMANSPEWTKMSNAQRQIIFEQLVYPLVIQKSNYQAYLKQGKTDAMARMAGATQQGLKKTGLDLQSLKLGNDGFAFF